MTYELDSLVLILTTPKGMVRLLYDYNDKDNANENCYCVAKISYHINNNKNEKLNKNFIVIL